MNALVRDYGIMQWWSATRNIPSNDVSKRLLLLHNRPSVYRAVAAVRGYPLKIHWPPRAVRSGRKFLVRGLAPSFDRVYQHGNVGVASSSNHLSKIWGWPYRRTPRHSLPPNSPAMCFTLRQMQKKRLYFEVRYFTVFFFHLSTEFGACPDTDINFQLNFTA